MARKEFTIPKEKVDWLLGGINAARRAPLIMLQCGLPRTPQEVANAAWVELGIEMGFEGMSVMPDTKKDPNGGIIVTAEERK